MLQNSKILKSRNEWREKAINRALENREHRKTNNRHKQTISQLKKEIIELKQIVKLKKNSKI
jgi:hypothetical protein